jgi:hypothetical protein
MKEKKNQDKKYKNGVGTWAAGQLELTLNQWRMTILNKNSAWWKLERHKFMNDEDYIDAIKNKLKLKEI